MADQELLSKFGATITEVDSSRQLNGILERGSVQSVLQSERVQNSINALIECSRDVGCKTYLVEIDGKRWATVAGSNSEILPFIEGVDEFNRLQGSIDPDKLPGTCIYVHEFAATSGYADGLYSRRESTGNTRKTVYENMGIHKVAFRDNARAQRRMFVDLTAKTYSFTDSPDNASNAVMEGLLVIDQIGSTKNLEGMYRSRWERDSFDPSVSRAAHRNKWGKFFLKA